MAVLFAQADVVSRAAPSFGGVAVSEQDGGSGQIDRPQPAFCSLTADITPLGAVTLLACGRSVR